MGELFGGGSAKKAAKAQAKATIEAARMNAVSANEQARANTQQMALAQEQRAQSQIAEDLLSRPMEAATVDLAADDGSTDSDDLLTRRRSTRSAYQSQNRAGLQVP